MRRYIGLLFLLYSLASLSFGAETPAAAGEGALVDFQWGFKIPLRDGVQLHATVYRPHAQKEPVPCIFTLTPYVAQRFHERGVYLASHGYVFLTVDARGRGNSEGEFTPLLQEVKDGPDVVEWLARQPFCDGKISMWGGSYGGYDQWVTAMKKPPHLASIVPVASPKPGVEFPPRTGNINWSYDVMWTTLTAGRTAQDDIFDDAAFWDGQFGQWYRGHHPFRDLDTMVGAPSPSFQTWIAHPHPDAYWDGYVPTAAQYAAIDIPILSITGQYDDDQPGALSFYREHMRFASPHAREQHYLVIGPWDHGGTRTPQLEQGGLKFGPASRIDLNALHKSWYDWTLKGAAKPEFLKSHVAYYMLGTGAEEWRYSDSLDAVTEKFQPMYLDSRQGIANDVFASGVLATDPVHGSEKPDRYVYDPLDTDFSAWDDSIKANGLIEQRGLLGATGKILVYHTLAFQQDVELAGSFRLSLYLAMDQPDTDIAAFVYEVKADGSSLLLGSDMLRARYRLSFRDAVPVRLGVVERYDFKGFNFIARRVAKGSRIRLAIGPVNSKYMEKNYNTGGVVAEESGKDARTVVVTLYHDERHESAIYLPLAVADKR